MYRIITQCFLHLPCRKKLIYSAGKMHSNEGVFSCLTEISVSSRRDLNYAGKRSAHGEN